MKIYFTLAEAAANRGQTLKPKAGKETPTCSGCREDTSPYGCATIYPRGAKMAGLMPKPMCDKCVAKLEYWRDRLCSVVPSSQWGEIEILPKPCEYIRDIMRQDDQDAMAEMQKGEIVQ